MNLFYLGLMQLLLYLHLNLSFYYVLLKFIHHFYVIFSSSFLLSVGLIEYVSLLYIFPPIHLEVYTLFYSFSGNTRDQNMYSFFKNFLN